MQTCPVQFSRLVVSDFATPWTAGRQASCPSPTPGVYSNSGPLSRWCHPTISSSVIPFSSRLQSLPASGSFPMSPFFTSGGQSIGVSASASVLPVNVQDWFPLGWTGWISLLSKGLSRVFSNISYINYFSKNKTIEKWNPISQKLKLVGEKRCEGRWVVNSPIQRKCNTGERGTETMVCPRDAAVG